MQDSGINAAMGTRCRSPGPAATPAASCCGWCSGIPSSSSGAVAPGAAAGRPVTDLHPACCRWPGARSSPPTPTCWPRPTSCFLALPHGESAALVAELPAGPAGRRPRRRLPARRRRRLAAYYGGDARRHLDLRPARAAGRARRGRRGDPGRQPRLLRRPRSRSRSPRCSPPAWSSRARRRRGRGLRHLRRRPQGASTDAARQPR